jgi:hypothetical protein
MCSLFLEKYMRLSPITIVLNGVRGPTTTHYAEHWRCRHRDQPDRYRAELCVINPAPSIDRTLLDLTGPAVKPWSVHSSIVLRESSVWTQSVTTRFRSFSDCLWTNRTTCSSRCWFNLDAAYSASASEFVAIPNTTNLKFAEWKVELISATGTPVTDILKPRINEDRTEMLPHPLERRLRILWGLQSPSLIEAGHSPSIIAFGNCRYGN